jgi:hypothetical protein
VKHARVTLIVPVPESRRAAAKLYCKLATAAWKSGAVASDISPLTAADIAADPTLAAMARVPAGEPENAYYVAAPWAQRLAQA